MRAGGEERKEWERERERKRGRGRGRGRSEERGAMPSNGRATGAAPPFSSYSRKRSESGGSADSAELCAESHVHTRVSDVHTRVSDVHTR
eukprot:3270450-Rhodomonas_salina.1